MSRNWTEMDSNGPNLDLFRTHNGPVMDHNGPKCSYFGPKWNLKLPYFGPYLDLEKT